ncbi:cobalt ECF transporter T component CbiQ [[Clostridium] polysaccharolyticum]|uniref:Cobalt/nickel transport system permease protein n=1 Tax=[Clostridium] polysaccharolyticum TaxID=29364 RepID=A0A1H9Z921_9FIRM|nr:cobalt ECF transporter T component CbiQ [[Clostridium] polysaccharolyticum]SES77960.1 cobalt/nickel transport system permease protein [[Clostridium] polysaccharolyticum]
MKNRHHHALDEYSYISGMRQWNGTLKAVFSIAALLAVICRNSLKVSLLTLLYMCVLSVLAGKVHFRDYIRLLFIPFVFIFISGLAIMIQIGKSSGDYFCLFGSIPICISIFGTKFYITKESFWLAVNVGCKALGSISAMYMLTLSTPLAEILNIFRKMHVPDLIIELMHLIYRYIFILSDSNRLQRDAAVSRLGYRNYQTSIRSFSKGLANLLVISLKRAQSCYDAMEARGYDGTLRIMEEQHKITCKQVLWMAGYVLVIIISSFVWR